MKLARIQMLRFAAAAAVVVFHASATLATYVPFVTPDLIRHGDLGVALGALIPAEPEALRLGFFMNPMLLEFCFGVLIGLTLERRQLPWIAAAAVTAALLILLLFPTASSWRVWAAGLPAALLTAGAAILDARWAIRSRIGKAIAELGDATYSIYLVHALVVSAACKVLLALRPATAPFLSIIAITLAAILAGYVLHRLVERPTQTLTHQRWSRLSRGRAGAPGAG